MNKIALVAFASLGVGACAFLRRKPSARRAAWWLEPRWAAQWARSSAARLARWLLLLARCSGAPIAIAAIGAINTGTSIAVGAGPRTSRLDVRGSFGCAVASGERRGAQICGRIRGRGARPPPRCEAGQRLRQTDRRQGQLMTDISHSIRARGAIVAAAGIFTGALWQASLINSSRRPCAPSVLRTANDATSPQLSTWRTNGLSQACASPANQPQRPRAVGREIPKAIDIAGAGLQFLIQ